jgi:uncharacterized cupredoxin-like copper-binding protein
MPRHAIVPVAIAALAAATGCGRDDSSSSDAPAGAAKRDGGGSAAGNAVVRGGRVTVAMRDFKFQPTQLEAVAGKLRVTAKDVGDEPHEFVVIRTNRAPNSLPTKGGQASEAGAVGEIQEQSPGRTASHVFSLRRGRYVFICNVPGHYASGMYGRLTVQ